MGRKPVTEEARRVKLHIANVMVPNWVRETLGREAKRCSRTLKGQYEEALIASARIYMRRHS